MKKILFLVLFGVLCFSMIPQTQAQSPTPSVGKNWVIKVMDALPLNTTKPTVIVNPFFPNENVDYIQVFVKYASVTGDSCNLKIYPSPDATTFTTGFANRRTAFQWKNGDGTSKIMNDTVNLTRWPTASLKIVCDTLTRMTAGTVTVWIKPHFK